MAFIIWCVSTVMTVNVEIAQVIFRRTGAILRARQLPQKMPHSPQR
ncbi:MAG: hypothetical protein AW10_02026 [Candidatus Accumulibacter appositus]|uniref:Uncharacterized protein n=1 Tax=Candidatus Accumulibacter appositus TaxID=1454003 RepID=A0A011NBN4_9PROT|nr:hypothetical protein [Accumulibacter sp.]EXI80058.1 MAG: hypothetical protein AW10_02026 [Candidatus Accumulibacter appositus]HRF06182.1 hypothetical protein [Accumulibacter sp.]